MKYRRTRHWIPSIALVLLSGAAWTNAEAQFGTTFPGFYSLPNSDFTWVWGEIRDGDLSRSTDLDVQGTQEKFRCRLTARLSPSSRLSRMDTRQIEQELTGSLYFIEAAARLMNQLEYSFDLDWARLECVEPEPSEPDAEKEQERLDRAVERALRERERRRSRRSNEEN